MSGRRGLGLAGRILAELGVIILGVLIALWVEDYRQEREDRREERVLLETVREEYAENRRRLDRQLGTYERRAASQRTLLDLGADPARLRTISRDSLRNLLSFALRGGWYDPAGGAVTTLVYSGGLGLVRDAELRSLLSTWDTELEDFHRVQGAYNQLLEEQFLPWLRAGWTIVPRHGENSLDVDLPEQDYTALLGDPDARDYLTELIAWMEILKLTGGEVQDLLDRTEAQLDEVLAPDGSR